MEAPIMAAAINAQPLLTKATGKKAAAIMTNATPKLAPELTPKIYGSANGLRNSVCIIKPATDSEAPANTAVTAFGKRKLSNISEFIPSAPFPKNTERISLNDM